MTEAEWLACVDPIPMLEFLRVETSYRKLRLLACAIIRSVPISVDERSMWELVTTYSWFKQVAWQYKVGPDGEIIQTQDRSWITCHKAIEVAEQFADQPDLPDLKAALGWAACGTSAAVWNAESDEWHDNPVIAASSAFRSYIAGYFGLATRASDHLAEYIIPRVCDFEQPISQHFLPVIASLVRDVFRYPYLLTVSKPEWQTSDVIALAPGIYQDRAFDRLPILADALQDAGCDNEDILAHLRSDGPHVKGCWALDLVLAKQ